MTLPNWLDWAQRLQALGRIGLSFTTNPFDIERYEEIEKIAAEMMAAGSGEAFPAVHQTFMKEAGYMTPKVDVRGVVFRDEKILLVKELSDGGWTLPGGWADVNEPPGLAAEREVFEESGFEARAFRLMALYDRNQHGFPPYLYHVYKVFIECELTGGKAKASIETDGADFFAEDALPPLSLTRITHEVLIRIFELHRNPQTPADFD